jgi:hypothetical protein
MKPIVLLSGRASDAAAAADIAAVRTAVRTLPSMIASSRPVAKSFKAISASILAPLPSGDGAMPSHLVEAIPISDEAAQSD